MSFLRVQNCPIFSAKVFPKLLPDLNSGLPRPSFMSATVRVRKNAKKSEKKNQKTFKTIYGLAVTSRWRHRVAFSNLMPQDCTESGIARFFHPNLGNCDDRNIDQLAKN
jgi:16S rRNA A1518/A1519 N6-dimethyltransferase RsmA/KsgA/DIM1 with predicted DNA glycosylase/AP lyase activity